MSLSRAKKIYARERQLCCYNSIKQNEVFCRRLVLVIYVKITFCGDIQMSFLKGETLPSRLQGLCDK